MHKLLLLTSHPAARQLARYVQLGLLAGLCIYLLGQLSVIGWGSVLGSLPREPAFYALLVLNFLLLPASEILIYRPLWRLGCGTGKLFAALMRKQAFNDAIVGYSGEVFFFVWARRHVAPRVTTLFDTIKDNNIVSAAVSSSVALVVTLVFAATGQLRPLTEDLPEAVQNFGLLAAIAVMAVPIVLTTFGPVVKLSRSLVARTAGLHFLRLCLFESLAVLQWSIVLPGVPIQTWLAFVAAKMILTRVPMMPNKELMLLGLAVSLADKAGAESAALAGLFLAGTAVTQSLNFAVFLITSMPGTLRGPEITPAEPAKVTS